MKVLKFVIGVIILPLILLFGVVLYCLSKTMQFLSTKKVDGIKFSLYKLNSSWFVGKSAMDFRAFGGAFVIYADKAKLRAAVSNRDLPMKNRMAALFTEAGYSIYVVKDAVPPNMSKQEIEAIVSHEIGHIVNKHLIGVEGILVDVNAEQEADDYAVGKHGKQIVQSALIKMRDFNASIIEGNELAMINQRIDRLN